MKNHSRIVQLTILAFAFAVSNSYAVGWSAPVTITNYYMQETGNAVFTTSANSNPDGCITSHYLELDGTQPNFQALYATIMTAVATGAQVSIYYNGCLGGNSYPHISAIAVGGSW
jgi:hypothetical protein